MGLCRRQRIATLPLALVAHVIREAEAQERQRDPAAFVLLPHQQQPVAAALDVVNVALAGGDGAGCMALEQAHHSGAPGQCGPEPIGAGPTGAGLLGDQGHRKRPGFLGVGATAAPIPR
jgi:hypothetical protein